MNAINRNIVILPIPEVTEEAIERSKRAAAIGESDFVLNKSDKMPHLTLHQFAIPEDQEEQLREHIHRIASQTAKLAVTMKDYSLFGATGLFWDAVRTDELHALHKKLVTAIDPLRQHLLVDQHAPFAAGTPDIGIEGRASLLTYGNPLAMDAYWPHITLTSCSSKNTASAAIEKLSDEQQQFVATEIHLTEVGPSGTCPEVLATYTLTT